MIPGIIAQQAMTTPAYTAPLAPYTTGLWSCIGVQNLFGAYPYAFRVRRSSDNAEQDIPWAGATYDTAAYDAFVGSSDGFCAVAYDNTGLGNHWSQSTTSRQPRISLAGVHDGCLYFDGTDDRLVTPNNFPGGGNIELFSRMKARSNGAYFQILANVNVTTSGNNGLSFQNQSTSIDMYMFFNGAAAFTNSRHISTRNLLLTEAVHNFKGQRDGSIVTTWYVNNSAQPKTEVGGSSVAGSFSADPLYMGSDASGGAAPTNVKSWVIYSSDKSSSRLAISSLM